MIDKKIIADSPEPFVFSTFINNETRMPATSMYNSENASEVKKYVQILSSNQKNTALVKINPIYHTPAAFHTAFALFARKNGADSTVSNKKKSNWYKGWQSK
jgi:hypothetical protein